MSSSLFLYLPTSLLASLDAIAADRTNYPNFDRDAAVRFLYVLLRVDRGRAWYAFVNLRAERIRALTCHDSARRVLKPLEAAGIIEWNKAFRHAEAGKSFTRSYRMTAAQREAKTRSRRVPGLDPKVTIKKLRAYYRKLEQGTPDAIARSHEPSISQALYDAACGVQIDGQIPKERHRSHGTMIEARLARYFRSDEGGRCYTHLSPLKRKLRKYMRIDGAPLASIDLGASYFRSAILVYEKQPNADAAEVASLRDLYMNRDVYALIDPANRKRAKRAVSAYLCDSDPTRVSQPESFAAPAAIFFRTTFPNFDRFVQQRRSLTNGKLWVLWVRRERQTMNAIYRGLFERGLRGKIVDEHDGCRFPQLALGLVLSIATEVIDRDDGGLGKLKYEVNGTEYSLPTSSSALPSPYSFAGNTPPEAYRGRSNSSTDGEYDVIRPSGDVVLVHESEVAA